MLRAVPIWAALLALTFSTNRAIAGDCKTIADSTARLACFDALSTKQKAAKSPVAKQTDDIARAKQAVVRDLKDPMSAMFGDVYRGRYAIICGGVNAKNSYGGYTGMTAFVYEIDKDQATILNPNGSDPSSVLDGLTLYQYNCMDDKRAIMH
jgi:hypothetical protein